MKVIAFRRHAAFMVALMGTMVRFAPDENGQVSAVVEDAEAIELFAAIPSDYRLVDDVEPKAKAAEVKAAEVKADAVNVSGEATQAEPAKAKVVQAAKADAKGK